MACLPPAPGSAEEFNTSSGWLCSAAKCRVNKHSFLALESTLAIQPQALTPGPTPASLTPVLTSIKVFRSVFLNKNAINFHYLIDVNLIGKPFRSVVGFFFFSRNFRVSHWGLYG